MTLTSQSSSSSIEATVDCPDAFGTALLQQLERESTHLDEVLAFSLQLNDLLQKPGGRGDSSGEVEFQRQSSKRSEIVREAYLALTERFARIADGRRRLQSMLNAQPQDGLPRSNWETCLAQCAVHLRDELLRLRAAVKSKILEIQSVIVGNQVVLNYTLEFYGQLITGLTGGVVPSPAYNARGELASPAAISIVEQQC